MTSDHNAVDILICARWISRPARFYREKIGAAAMIMNWPSHSTDQPSLHPNPIILAVRRWRWLTIYTKVMHVLV